MWNIIGNTDNIETLMQEANIALKAVPHMAIQMRRMNNSMSMMSYSIDQSLGKMGSWSPIPWVP